jgi:ParB-like chromosome segregation protein Spo0J
MKIAPKKPAAVAGKAEKAKPEVITHPDGFVPISLIADHPSLHYRKLNDEHVAELKQSIRKNGLDVPLIVWDGGEDGIMEVAIDPENPKKGTQSVQASFLLSGQHRREALLGLFDEDPKWFEKKFPEGVPVTYRKGELKDAIAAQLRENVQRINPSAAEVLPWILKLQDEHGMKQSAIANAIGKSVSYVSEVLRIQKTLGKKGTEAVKSGDASLTDVANETRKASKKAKEEKREVTEDEAEEIVEKAKKKTAAKKSKGKQRAEKRPSLKKLYSRFKALPKMNLGAQLETLKGMIEYATGEIDELPEALQEPDSE